MTIALFELAVFVFAFSVLLHDAASSTPARTPTVAPVLNVDFIV